MKNIALIFKSNTLNMKIILQLNAFTIFKISNEVGLKLNIQKTKIMVSGPITSWQIDGEMLTLFWGAPESLQMVTAAMKLKDAYSLEEKL